MKQSNLVPILFILILAAIPSTLLWHKVEKLENQMALMSKTITTEQLLVKGTNNTVEIKAGAVECKLVQQNKTSMANISPLGFQQNRDGKHSSLSGETGLHIETGYDSIALRPGAALVLKSGGATTEIFAIGNQNTNATKNAVFGSGIAIAYGDRQGINIINSEDLNPKMEFWNKNGDSKLIQLKDITDWTKTPDRTEKDTHP